MIAVDTNILVYAKLIPSEFHTVARELLTRFSEGTRPWAIPWQCIYEYLHVITNPHTSGIDEILTADRDFSRFPLKVTNPFRS